MATKPPTPPIPKRIPPALWWALGAALGLVAVVVVSLNVTWPGWTGFDSYTTPASTTHELHPAKTLWDWLSLLIVPAVLAGGALWFSNVEHRSEQDLAGNRTKETQEIEKQ